MKIEKGISRGLFGKSEEEKQIIPTNFLKIEMLSVKNKTLFYLKW